jgi:general secretion pathway protein D
MLKTKWSKELIALGLLAMSHNSFAQDPASAGAPPPADVAPPPITPPPADVAVPPPADDAVPPATTTPADAGAGNKGKRKDKKQTAAGPATGADAGPETGVATSPNGEKTAIVNLGENGVAADAVPEGQELVNIDFPEQTDIKDIIRAVSLWTGKNVILGRDVNGKVQMISPRKVTKEEAYQAFLSALNLLSLTTVETGKVIKILPTQSAVKGNLKTFLGSSWTPMTDEMITQIVPLKYIDAKEIQTTLSRIVASNSMIAYRPTNTLIISDTGFKVRRLLDIIELLDVQGQQPQLSIVPIKFADAKQIADKVTEIFKAKGADKSKGEYLSYKIMTDERTNSVIIFGPPRTIADVKALVQRFDIRVLDPSRVSSIHVRPLDFADAKKVSATLSALASGSKNKTATRRPPIGLTTSKDGKTNGGSGGDGVIDVAEFDDNLKITADESSNALLITGSRAAYEAINTIIRKLDVRRSQVFVESDILDINVGGNFEFGTSIFAGAKKSKDGTQLAYTWEAGKIAPLVGSQVAGAKSDQSKLNAVNSLGEDFNIGVLAGFKVNVPGIGEVTPGALIKMIKTDASSRELASPSILTLNNETAKITVGDRLFYKSSGDVNPTTGIAPSKVEHEDVDLTLDIKPSISHTNYVTMKVDLDANTGSIDPTRGVPSVSKRKLSQNVTVKSGQTVVISGLMKTSESESYSKIPLLGDIPILGWLFRNSSLIKRRVNLMIFLTPHIVHGADDLASIYQKKLQERDEFFRIIYGRSYEDEDFYKLLPNKEDGVYKSDPFEELEKKNRDARMAKLQEDMGYPVPVPAAPNADAITDPSAAKAEGGTEGSNKPEVPQPVPVPVDSGDGGGTTSPNGEGSGGNDLLLEGDAFSGGETTIGGDGGGEAPPPPEGGGEPPPPPEPPPIPEGGE